MTRATLLGPSLLLALALAGCGGSGANPPGSGGAGGGGGGTGAAGGGTSSSTTGSTTSTGTGGSPGHTVGGAVTGLSGAGLVLQDNGGDDLPVAGAGAFTFPTPLASGAGYAVTVLAQPASPTQTCAVTMGAGTIGAADVTDVAVTCTTNEYAVGGVVKGLLGSGLVLQLDGGGDLPVAADGPYAFAGTLASGQSYDVTVLSQPASPAQTCTPTPGMGVVGGADVSVPVTCKLVDGDGDGIPDLADPFPADPTKPHAAMAGFVYPQTASQLFRMDVNTYAITSVGTFNGPGFSGSVTDVAIDQFGVLYAITFTDLYVCDADTATCHHLATLPTSFNGLTMVPPGTLHPFLDTLVGIANSGAWYRVGLTGSSAAQLTAIGGYGSGYASSGDVFSIEGVGTFAAVDKAGQGYDYIVSVNPLNGAVLSEVGALTGYSNVYGLAGWAGVVFGFDATGAVLKIDITNGTSTVLAQTANSWWGAAVATRIAVP